MRFVERRALQRRIGPIARHLNTTSPGRSNGLRNVLRCGGMQAHLICWQTQTVVSQTAAIDGANDGVRIQNIRGNLLESGIAERVLKIGRAARHHPHRHILPAAEYSPDEFRSTLSPQDCDIRHGDPRDARVVHKPIGAAACMNGRDGALPLCYGCLRQIAQLFRRAGNGSDKPPCPVMPHAPHRVPRPAQCARIVGYVRRSLPALAL